MLEGIQEGQTDNAKNHHFMDWDIYDASGSDWIPSNIISNPYLSGVRGLILLKQWRAEGLSESQIQERFLKDNILGAFGSGPDINEIVHQVRNGGLSVDDALRLATLTVYGKVTDNASKGKNVTGKETDANKPLDKTDLELQHGKGNVEQGGGNYKETKDKILDNQDTNQKANESSNFGEHVKKEQEINANLGKRPEDKIWTETSKKESVTNAYDHWDKHKHEFPEFQNSKQYVDATHNFVRNPPEGTLTKVRENGDTLYYNPSTNIFAIKNADGTPRTMFKPNPADHGYKTNLEYFNAQK